MAMLSMMMQGVFDRFPRLRVAFMESGCSWAPAWLHRMDEHVELTGWHDFPDSRAQAERVLPSQLLHLVRPR